MSDGPYPASLRLPHNYLNYPGEFGGSESCMLKEKNSSLTMLIDSTSSIMRTASSTFHCLIGSARRASYCGEPDPTIQLSANGQSGSLYLLPAAANSNESSLSTGSYDEQRRTLTIYDGRIPSATTAPTIPFELMTPIDAITQTLDDPVESFVQIVLEEPEERPPIIRPISSPRRNSSPRHRHRQQNDSSNILNLSKKLSETQSMPETDRLNSLEIHQRTPEVIEPMDFSFLEPVLRGESAAPPVNSHRSGSLPQSYRQISQQNNLISDDSAMDVRPSSRPSHRITIHEDHSTVTPSMGTGRLKVPSPIA